MDDDGCRQCQCALVRRACMYGQCKTFTLTGLAELKPTDSLSSSIRRSARLPLFVSLSSYFLCLSVFQYFFVCFQELCSFAIVLFSNHLSPVDSLQTHYPIKQLDAQVASIIIPKSKWLLFNSVSPSAPPPMSRPSTFSDHGTTTPDSFLFPRTPLRPVAGREPSASKDLLSRLASATGTTYVPPPFPHHHSNPLNND
jgi:hypothetical protein